MRQCLSSSFEVFVGNRGGGVGWAGKVGGQNSSQYISLSRKIRLGLARVRGKVFFEQVSVNSADQ